jgi:zinc protease
MSSRVTSALPPVGPPASIVFPRIERTRLSTGLAVWSITRHADPIVSCQILIAAGSAHDPIDRPGLAGLTADMLDEGAGGRDAVAIAESIARLGTTLGIETAPDTTTLSFTALERCLEPMLVILADVVSRPHLAEADLLRVTELRRHRLRQLSATAPAQADRAFVRAVFGSHPYGHGALGTTTSLNATTVDDVRAFHAAMVRPSEVTLIVVGDVTHARVVAAVQAAFGAWLAPSHPGATELPEVIWTDDSSVMLPVLLVDRPGSPQVEVRVGHPGPARTTRDYYALVTLNALLGGQFTSRLNVNLRETRGITYGVRTGFDFRRAGGSFACETSVQADAAAVAAAEILREFDAVGRDGAVAEEELARAQASLTRGYVRQFETADHVSRAAAQLAIFGLDDRTYDRFVPLVDALDGRIIEDAARRTIRAPASAIVLVGDAARTRPQLDRLGRPIVDVVPEF